MKVTNFQALAVTISLVVEFVSSFADGGCPATVFSPELGGTLDVFSILTSQKRNRCFFTVSNDFDPSTIPDERCNTVVPGSVASNQNNDANGNIEDKANYIVCEILPGYTDDSDDDLGAVAIDDEVPKQEMDVYLKECYLKQLRPKSKCIKMRKALVAKLGGRPKAEPILIRRRYELDPKKGVPRSTLIAGGAGSFVIVIVIIIVAYIALCRSKGAETTEETSKKSKSRSTSMAATPSSRSSVSQSSVSKMSRMGNVDSDEDDKKSKRRKKKKKRRKKKRRH